MRHLCDYQTGQNLFPMEMFWKYGPLWLSMLKSSNELPGVQFWFSWPGQSCAVAISPLGSTAVMWISLLGCWKSANWGGTWGTGSCWFVTNVNDDPSCQEGVPYKMSCVCMHVYGKTGKARTVESTRSAQALLPTRGRPKTVVVTSMLGSSFILSIIPSMLAMAAPRLCPVTSTFFAPVDSSADCTVDMTRSAVLSCVSANPSCILTSSASH